MPGNKPDFNLYWRIGPVAMVDVSTPAYPSAVAMVAFDRLPHILDGLGRWSARRNRNRTILYARRNRHNPHSTEFMHHAIMGKVLVDHRNGDGLDNRDENLRRCSVQQNNQNRRRRSDNTSGFRGVCRRDGRWRVKIQNDILGYFDSAEEAARVYDVAASARYGEFARLNFPGETS